MEVLRQWKTDAAHSSIEFVVRHMMVSKVRGKFGSFAVTFEGDPNKIEAGKVSVDIDVQSIYTGEKGRDDDLRSGNFFESEKYPKIKFASDKISKTGDETYDISGTLTIKNASKNVTFHGEFGGSLKDPFGNNRFGFSADTSINRRDFGLTWQMILDNGGLMVGDIVKIEVSLELVEIK
ncbi:MAG: YceI family protein [Thermoplasmata archaeon]